MFLGCTDTALCPVSLISGGGLIRDGRKPNQQSIGLFFAVGQCDYSVS